MHLQIYEAIIDALPVLFFGMGWWFSNIINVRIHASLNLTKNSTSIISQKVAS